MRASLRILGLLSRESGYPEVLTVKCSPAAPPDTACDRLPFLSKTNIDRARIGPEELGGGLAWAPGGLAWAPGYLLRRVEERSE